MKFFDRFHENDIALNDAHRSITAAQAEARVHALFSYFRSDLALLPGETIALLLSNRLEVFELLLAGIAAGLHIVPLNHQLKREELFYILKDSNARILVHDSVSEDPFDFGGRSLSIERIEEGIEGHLGTHLEDVGDLPPGGPTIYTSGTTGRPKAVVRSRPPRLVEAVRAFRKTGALFGLDGSGAHLVAGPLYHAAPLLFALYDLLNGARVIIHPRFQPRALLDSIRDEQIAHLHLVPTHFIRLLRLPEQERTAFDPSPIRLALHGAAPIAPSVKRAMIEWWGPKLREYWGATEGGIYTLIDAAEWLEREGSVGRPLPHFEIAAFDERGRRLPPHHIGTLYVRHRENPEPFVYRGDPGKTRDAYLGGGFFTAGDLGHLDEAGYVYLSARRSDLILSGGVNIYPKEIEAAAIDDEAVEDIYVFGEPDEEWGERVVAAIAFRPGQMSGTVESAVEALRKRLANRLAGYKLPRVVEVHRSLPRNEAGKIRKGDLGVETRITRIEF